MGTQATLAVMQKGKVIVKIITGCNGWRMESLKKWIEETGTIDPAYIVDKCKSLEVGCDGCLTVQFGPSKFYNPINQPVVDTNGLYASKFEDPTFNPRWSCGVAAYSLIVDVPVDYHANQRIKFVAVEKNVLVSSTPPWLIGKFGMYVKKACTLHGDRAVVMVDGSTEQLGVCYQWIAPE